MTYHRCRARFSILLALAASLGLCAAAFGADVTLQLRVDATELPRHLLHSEIRIPAEPGKPSSGTPKWIPGTHSPDGRMQPGKGSIPSAAGTFPGRPGFAALDDGRQLGIIGPWHPRIATG